MAIRIGLTVLGTTIVPIVSIAPVRGDEYLVRAILADGRAYVAPLSNFFAREPSWKEPGGYFTLLGRSLAEDDPAVTLRTPYVVEKNPVQSVLHRWQIDAKQVHFVRYAPPFTAGVAMPLCMRESYLVSLPLDQAKKFTAPIRETLADSAGVRDLDRFATSIEAGPAVWRLPLIGRLSDVENSWVSFDFLPAADGRYEWYASVPEKKNNRATGQNRVTRWDSEPPAKKGEETKWVERGTWAVENGTALFATAAGDYRFFVAQSGHVYAVPKGAKAGATLKEVWKDKPVDALIHDADNAKWYAFTKEQYFEIADPIKPKAHTLDVRRAKTADEALETAVKCGRVIRGLPELKQWKDK